MTLARTPMKRATIRQLRPGEPLPAGEPRRYPNGAGYVRLRWKVGSQQYVEVYEHRLTAGLPPAEVHHRDHSKANNDPANLEVLTKVEHARRHGAELASQSRRVTEWGGLRGQEAFDRRQRRLEREASRREFLAQIAALYADGKTTVEIGDQVGRHHSGISRALRAAGVAPGQRKKSGGEVTAIVRSRVQARAQMRCEICSTNLVWAGGQVHHRMPRGMGGSRVPERHQPQNLLFVCLGCHQYVESNRAEALENGWLVLSRTDSATVAVLIHRSRWVYLTEDAQYADAPPMVAA